MNNQSLQDEEIDSLQSIYFPHELVATKTESNQWAIIAHISVDLPPNFQVSNGSGEDRRVITVNHLPDIKLRVRFGDGYPSSCAPVCYLQCKWLTEKEHKRLRRGLLALWEQNQGFAIVHTWIEYVKTRTLEDLGISNEINITGLKSNPRNKQKPSKACLIQRGNTLLANLERYNALKLEEEFLKTHHQCMICFSEHLGSNSMLFTPCQHIFCRSCLRDYFTTVINDGNCTSVKCPGYKCETGVFQNQVKELLPVELFEKYDKLLLNLWLDTKPNVIYCPRPQCQYPVMREGDDKLAECPTCNYAFCIYCRCGYHGIEPCKMNSEAKLQLVDGYQKATAEERKKLELRYGKKQIENLVNDTLSETWIQGNSKKCPQCGVGIEKSDGCNKMTCFRCSAYFCWLCSSLLDRFTPYLHFQDPKSPCNNRLFEFHEEEEEDWEIEVLELGLEDSGSEDIETDDPESDDELAF